MKKTTFGFKVETYDDVIRIGMDNHGSMPKSQPSIKLNALHHPHHPLLDRLNGSGCGGWVVWDAWVEMVSQSLC